MLGEGVLYIYPYKAPFIHAPLLPRNLWGWEAQKISPRGSRIGLGEVSDYVGIEVASTTGDYPPTYG
jgi:hypothetical protein